MGRKRLSQVWEHRHWTPGLDQSQRKWCFHPAGWRGGARGGAFCISNKGQAHLVKGERKSETCGIKEESRVFFLKSYTQDAKS